MGMFCKLGLEEARRPVEPARDTADMDGDGGSEGGEEADGSSTANLGEGDDDGLQQAEVRLLGEAPDISCILFAEREYSPAKEEQAESRLHRIGQQNAVQSYYLLAKDTIDEDVHELIEEKRRLIS